MEKLILNMRPLVNARELSRSQIKKVMGGGGTFTTISPNCPGCNNGDACTHSECPDCVTQDPNHNPVGACQKNS